MGYTLVHNCIKVSDLERSLKFYREVLHMHEKGRIVRGEMVLVYLGDEAGSAHELELNYHPDHAGRFDLGENSVHFAFMVEDFEAALAEHKRQNYVKINLEDRRVYFIEDPDGYLIEIMPVGHSSMTGRDMSHADK